MKSTFLDTEELSQALRHANVTAMQVTPGRYCATLTRAAVGDWSLQYIRFEKGASVCVGDAPRDTHAILVPLSLAPRCRLLGEPLEGATLGIYAPGSEHADATSAGCELAVLVAPPGFAPHADREGLGLPRQGSHVRQVCQEGLGRLQHLLREIPGAVDELSQKHGRAAAESALRDALQGAIAEALRPIAAGRGEAGAGPGRPRMPRTAILKRIREILDSRRDQPIYAAELAAAVGISQPSLQRVFHEWFAMPPARYLTLKRLYLVRQQLRDRRGQTVTEVAGSLGFWDLSRLSKSYKAVFGQLPSDTLRGNGRQWECRACDRRGRNAGR